MKKCPKCGYANNNYRENCFKCGTTLLGVTNRTRNHEVISMLTNPLESVWLIVFQWYIIIVSLLTIIFTPLSFYFYGSILLTISIFLSSILNYILGMVLLNFLYNVHALRINSDSLLKLTKDAKKNE